MQTMQLMNEWDDKHATAHTKATATSWAKNRNRNIRRAQIVFLSICLCLISAAACTATQHYTQSLCIAHDGRMPAATQYRSDGHAAKSAEAPDARVQHHASQGHRPTRSVRRDERLPNARLSRLRGCRHFPRSR